MSETTHSMECQECGAPLEADRAGPCPACGSARQHHRLGLSNRVKASADLRWKKMREYYENRPWLLALVVALTFGAPFLGLVLAGPAGLLAGLGLGLLTLLIGFAARTKVREIERG